MQNPLSSVPAIFRMLRSLLPLRPSLRLTALFRCALSVLWLLTHLPRPLLALLILRLRPHLSRWALLEPVCSAAHRPGPCLRHHRRTPVVIVEVC